MSIKNGNDVRDDQTITMDRRKFIVAGASVAATSMLSFATAAQASSEQSSSGVAGSKKSQSTSDIGKRKLGSLEVSSIGIGVQNMHRKFDTTVPYRPQMIKILREAYERGVTFFDTAEAYGPFENERILGEAISPFRDKIKITSKFGWNIDPKTGKRGPGLNSRPEHIKIAVEGSLKRLGTDHIDLLYQHRVDPQVPIEDVAGAVKDLMDQGKVLHWGLSEPGIQTIRRAHAELPLTAIQNEYSMATRDQEKAVIPLCEELGIGFVPWWPLNCQLLTGCIDAETNFAPGDFRSSTPRFSPENLAHNMQLIELIKRWADRKNAVPAQIPLAWLMAQRPWIVPIPGTTVMAHMIENVGATDVKFTPNELTELNAELNAIEIRGQRLPDGVLAFSGVEAPLKG
ncbi:aldo/keto reductase [Vibrio olivae]|uniref:Aldo/keto reductase n=1 Tax=Vibrio olivae TaxID=1243002 RepID=A0ABV5HJS1_9VIBR